MITLGALVLLGLVILRVTSGFLTTSTVLTDAKLGVLGVSIATSVVEEASSKAFDEASDSNSVYLLNSLTPAASLGPEYGESLGNFNDFDDYNGLNYTDTISSSAPFKIECWVNYITTSNPNGTTSSRTWHKRIDVQVTSPGMVDTIKMSTVYSYWYFR